jgi:hypothetical protein
MSLRALRDLLQSIFSGVNATNRVPPPLEVWENNRATIESLLTSSEVQDELISLDRGIVLPKSVETARVLQNLRQRFQPEGRWRPLVGRIRVEALLRKRPKFDRNRSSLTGEAEGIAELSPKFDQFSSFHVEGWERVLDAIRNYKSLIIVAPTGSGKTEVFLMPTIFAIAQGLKAGPKKAPHFVLLYPRVALLKDQLSRIFRYVYNAEQVYLGKPTLFGPRPVEKGKGIVIGFQFGGIASDFADTKDNRDIFSEDSTFLLIDRCPICNSGRLKIPSGRRQGGITLLRCNQCSAEFRTTISKKDHAKVQPHLLVTTAESLDRIYLNPIPDFEEYLKNITGIIIDEVHMYYSLYGVHIYNLLRRIEELKGGQPLVKLAASATVASPGSFAAKLFYGNESPSVPIHTAEQYEQDTAGLEMIYFLQSPEEGNRPGAAPTLIQSVMALNHATLRGSDRSIVFTESLDMAGRLEAQIHNAEAVRGLWEFRTNINTLTFRSLLCPRTTPTACPNIYLQGECWRGILGGQNCTQPINGLHEQSLKVVQVSSQQQTRYWEGDIVVATPALEVGVDDERIKSTLHYLPPRTVFSFIQRRGRAGRKSGDVSYTLMILGNTPSDHFYFFRRNRLINGTYELPLNPQNPIIRSMHNRLQIERERMRQSIVQAGQSPLGIWNWIWETITQCSLINRYYREKLGAYRGRGLDEQRRYIYKWITDEKAMLESYLNLRWMLRTIEDEAPDRLRDSIEKVTMAVDDFISNRTTDVEEVSQQLRSLNQELFDLYLEETDREARSPLESMRNNILRIWDVISEQTWGIESRHAENLYDFFRTLESLYPKDKKTYILNSAPDALKIVLQALFYLHLGIETSDEGNCSSRIEYFIPSAYFQAVKPLIVEIRYENKEREPALRQEDITNAATLLIPYKPIYRYHAPPFLSIVDTEHDPAKVSSNGQEVIIRLRAEGLRQNGILTPQKIYVKPLKSDDQGQQVVKMCPQCYAIYSVNRQRRCHENLRPVKLYAEPIVERNYASTEPPRQVTRTLRFLSNMQGTTMMKGADVRANIAVENNNEYTITPNIFREFSALYDTPIRYGLSTNGIAWDLSKIVPYVLRNTAVRQRVEQAIVNGRRKQWNEELILHTAAHMLHKTIAAVSGVNEQLLEYWYDTNRREVVIWERYEGGAGISEVFENALRTNPVDIYQELLSSILCLIDLAERQDWSSPEELKTKLGERWKLASDNEAIASIVQEADRERQVQLQQQNEEARLICRPPQGSDGCANCIHTTYCTKRNEQTLTVSRLAGEALLYYLVRRVTREQMETLRGEANTQGFAIPTVLNADPIRETYDVLLL